MELPPYRRPTVRSVAIHVWMRSKQYLQKMGTVILAASIIVWFMSYYPRQNELREQKDQQVETLTQSTLPRRSSSLALIHLSIASPPTTRSSLSSGVSGTSVNP